MKTTISDLLDIIHDTIIRHEGENSSILQELKSIDDKIKSGKLKDHIVDTPFFKSIIRIEYPNI